MHSEDTINNLFDKLRADRTKGIEAIAGGPKTADNEDTYFFATMAYDMEHAPLSTNWEMLELIGINPDTDPVDEIILGLSKWGIYFTDPMHTYTDEALRERLHEILREKIRMLPPSPDFSEFIDIRPVKSDSRIAPVSDRTIPKPPAREMPVEDCLRVDLN